MAITFRGEIMELGEKMRKARLEAGLTQRQLAEGIVTRNMLSQIENGSARPSMKTLAALAQRLEVPLGYFLEEAGTASPNQAVMESLRRLYDNGQYAEAALILEAYRAPDPIYDREKALLQNLIFLNLAEQAVEQGKERYALELLEKAQENSYCSEAIRHQRLLIQGRIRGQKVSHLLPDLDEELLLRAEEALEEKNHVRAGELLDAARDRTNCRWLLLRGKAWAAAGNYSDAARCFHGAESRYPEEAAEYLELCYRELEDYRQAYNYARKRRK